MIAEIWKGAAAPIGGGDLARAADRLGCDLAALRAVLEVEAAGRWFLGDGTLPRRFEPHALPPADRAALGWSGGWRESLALGSGQRAALFARAYAANAEAAAGATSWGAPQVMGYHAPALGMVSAVAMAQAMADGAGAQLAAFVAYVEWAGAAPALRARDWLAFARIYNGRGQAATYAGRIAAAWHAATLEAATIAGGGGRSAQVLREGARGASVRQAQAALGVRVDGRFGPETAAAASAFQGRAGLAVDGVIGAKTWGAMRDHEAAAGWPDFAPSPVPRPRAIAGRVEVASGAIRDATGAIGAASGGLRMAADAVGGISPAILEPLGIAAAVALSAFAISAAVVYARREIRATPSAGA
jgi:peptidoglycan hydrolase-like protein with peptidoglycan-binding domain